MKKKKKEEKGYFPCKRKGTLGEVFITFTPKEKSSRFCGNPHINLLFAYEESSTAGGNAAATEERKKR